MGNNQKAEDLITKWENMPSKTEEEKALATEFYKKEIFPISIKAYQTNSKKHLKEGYDYMILSVGTSFEPIVLSLKLWNPKKVLFLYTDKSESQLDTILEYVQLKPSQYDKRLINSTRILSIYQEIRKVYDKWERPEKIIVDPTGGTKAMTAATAMAGHSIKATLVYVAGSKYSKKHRRPMPGTEYLAYIDNPLKEFGELKKEKAADLFNENDFRSAKLLYQELAELPIDAKEKYESYYYLANMYEEWDNLQIEQAAESGEQLKTIMASYVKFKMKPCFASEDEKVQQQIKIIQSMKNFNHEPIKKVIEDQEAIVQLIYTLLEATHRREDQGKFDMAVLLLYRILELMMQRRLWHYNLITSTPRYSQINIKGKTERDIEGEYSRLFMKIHRKKSNRKIQSLPPTISLMSGYVLLAVFKDGLISKNREGFLYRLNKNKDLRNNSIFAHGFKTITAADYKSYEEVVQEVITNFCQIESIDHEGLEQQYKFIKIE